MKRICAAILAVLIAVSAVSGSVGAVSLRSDSEKLSLSELAGCYFQCLKAENPSITLAKANSCLLGDCGTGFFRFSTNQKTSEIRTRSKKILDFYNLANADGFTKFYHPNLDLSINEAEILTGLPNDNSLCIMLFGNKLNEDGTMSDKFIARSMTALAMANKYPNALIMVTGGHTAGLKYPSEAETGRKWLIDHGIDAGRIIIDPISWDTFSNILCTFTTSELSKHTEIQNFVVVSSDYHVPRCSIYLMTYIYAFGYDLPREQGGRGYQYLGNLGAVLG